MTSITLQCPGWDYEDIPGWKETLSARTKAALIRLRQLNPAERINIGKDGRPVHERYFAGLTPPGCEYYAGHYRGENYTCLKNYLVQITNDPLVGHPPDRVLNDMKVFATDFAGVVSDSDFVWAANSRVITPSAKLYRVIQLGVALFVNFLQIHPYANGNGHLARFFLITYLARYKVFLARWPMHPRPQDPPYSELIHRYRRGDRLSLEQFVMSCI
jgi:Fic/DOC family